MRTIAPTLGRRFALAAAAMAVCALLLAAAASAFLAWQQQNQSRRLLMEREARQNAVLLSTTLEAICTRLKDAASSSLLANALVDSAGRQTYLVPYLHGLQSINGVAVQILFTDFEGKEIASSGSSHFSARELQWLKPQLDSGKARSEIQNGADGEELWIVELLTYTRTNSPEGALMYKVKLRDLQKGLSARLIWRDRALLKSEDAILLPVRLPSALQGTDLRLVQENTAGVESNLAPSILPMILTPLLLGAVVFWLGLRLAPGLTRDLRALDDFARSVVENGFGEQRSSIEGSVEVRSLANSINHMLDRLHQQHLQLQADSEARYRLLVEGTNAISWEAALPFRYTYISPQAQAILSVPLPAWLEVDFWQQSCHPEDLLQVMQIRARALEEAHHQRREYRCEYRLRHSDGQYLWLEEIASVLEDEQGQARRLRGILLDINERKLAEQRLQQERSKVDRLKTEFISTVSHELRTPITSILGSLGLILAGTTGELADKTRKLLDIAHKNSERLLRLINDLLDIDKIVSGKMIFEWQWLDLAQLLAQAVDANQAYAEKLGVRLQIRASEPEVLVKVDANRLLQVLANLLSNAAKFSPKGGVVEVWMEAGPQSVRVCVKDYGSGIAPEFRDKIFEKFSQQDSSDTRLKGGTGLGLAITKVLLEQMGGQIDFESAPGQGSTFFFDLPR